jgi:multidrug efflux pump subunit AcrB
MRFRPIMTTTMAALLGTLPTIEKVSHRFKRHPHVPTVESPAGD